MSTRLRASGLLGALVGVGLLAAFVSALLVGDARSASHGSGLIAFTRDDGVYVVGVDGTGLHPLWQGTRVTEVTWSPDGRKLAVGTAALSGHPRSGGMWVMNADGSNPVRVARVDASSLSWSADGRRIAFTRYFHADSDIWLMNADGSNVRRLKRTPELFERNVDWKPTGGWLAFNAGGYVPLVYVMRTNGRNVRKLPPPPTLRGWPDSLDPDWSPDGRRIVFASIAGPGIDFEVWVMNASGKQWVRLTTNRVQESSPVWSPDGRRIAFVRGKPFFGGIYVMNADGTGVRKLTKGASPAWQPMAPAGG